jgi:hypothetical protein
MRGPRIASSNEGFASSSEGFASSREVLASSNEFFASSGEECRIHVFFWKKITPQIRILTTYRPTTNRALR